MEFTIPIAPRTKKNGMRIVIIKGHPRILPSKNFIKYQEDCKEYIPELLIAHKVNVKALYYMDSRRRVDLCNLHEALHDVLVHYGCLIDDNSNIIVSTDGSRVLYDKDHPRTEVTIERIEE